MSGDLPEAEAGEMIGVTLQAALIGKLAMSSKGALGSLSGLVSPAEDNQVADDATAQKEEEKKDMPIEEEDAEAGEMIGVTLQAALIGKLAMTSNKGALGGLSGLSGLASPSENNTAAADDV